MLYRMDRDCEHLVGTMKNLHQVDVPLTGSRALQLLKSGGTIDHWRFCPRCGISLANFWIAARTRVR